MATNFPASLDTLTNPTSSDSLSSPSHSAQHANVNDAVEALQAKVGVDSSAVASSLDYKIAQLEAQGTHTDYSGSITFSGFTLGNGTVVTNYARVNDLVAFSGRVVLGSTSSMTGPLDISLPVSAASLTNPQAGIAYCDNPFRHIAACGVFGNVNNMRIFAENYGSTYSAVADISSTVPFSWASTHSFGWNLIYLAA